MRTLLEEVLPRDATIDAFEVRHTFAGLGSRTKGGYYHDGRFATLPDVVEHYDRHLRLALAPADKADLVEFLKSL